LRDGDRVVNDSSVICAYVERRHPNPPLYPKDDYEYARALWFEEFVDGGLIPIGGPKIFLPLVLRPLLTQKPPDDATEAAARKAWDEELAPLFDYLETQIGDGEYMVGGRLSIADVTLASPFVNLRHAGFAPARKRWPRLRAFLDRLHGRPSYKKLIDEETPVFGKRAARIAD
jgi:glutathione S-transferase